MNQSEHADVAVVDDDFVVLESIMDLLASAGLSALRFSSAREFLDSPALDTVGCLVSDIRMPDMDGWELRAIVAARRPELPIILITAHEADERQASPDSRQLLLGKPFDAQRLLSAITSVLRQPKA